MRPLQITDADTIILGLQDEIRRSPESRYNHRLHGVLLVAQGLSCRAVAEMLGDAPRTVANWVHRFEAEGLAGLVEDARPGRPSRLSVAEVAVVDAVLRGSPRDFGLTGNLWDGKTLSAWLAQERGLELGVRQCQRLFRQLDFRLRKPRPLLAKADPVAQARYKKTPAAARRSRRGRVGPG